MEPILVLYYYYMIESVSFVIQGLYLTKTFQMLQGIECFDVFLRWRVNTFKQIKEMHSLIIHSFECRYL